MHRLLLCFNYGVVGEEVLTCRQSESYQVGEKIAGEVPLSLVKRGRYLTTDLLC